MTFPTTQNFQYRIMQDKLVSYVEPSTNFATGSYQLPLAIPVSGSGGTNYVLNLATLFAGLITTPAIPSVLTIQDVSSPGVGFWIRTASGSFGTGIQIRPNSIFTCGLAALPTLYVDNISALVPLDLLLTVTA